jgi:PAS domain S-box-containing protein
MRIGHSIPATIIADDPAKATGAIAQLKQQEELYRLVFETNPSPMWIFETDSLRILAVNEAAIRQYGYSKREFLNLTILELRSEEDRAATMAALSSAKAPSHFSGLFRHLRKDGSEILVEIYSSPLLFKKKPARITTAIDVTVREEAARKVRAHEAALAFAQRVAQVGSWTIKLTADGKIDGNLMRWSDEGRRILGLDSAKTSTESFFKLIHPDDYERVAQAFEKVITKGESYSLEHRIVDPSGATRILHNAADILRDDQDGAPAKIVGVFWDVTEERKAGERLREQANMLDLAHDAVLVRGLDDSIQFWNKGAERLYGWSAAEAQTHEIPDSLDQDRSTFANAKTMVLQNDSWAGDVQQCCKNGQRVTVNSRWTLLRDETGQPRSILVINNDITEQKRLEAQFLKAQRLESIGTLASGVAHDLNNILVPILLASPILQTETDPAERAKLLSLIETSAERGAAIVKQVLTFARGADGERVLVQPIYLIDEVAKIAQQTFPRSITIRTKHSKNLWTVTADPTQLHQVLLNLCVNARDAMPNGGELLLSGENFEVDEHYASMIPDAKPGPHVLFSVVDNGTGIPAAVIDKIFDPFFTTKEVGKGTGLGLSTAIGIVKNHGGFVNVYSEPGRGTTFKIFIPAAANTTTVKVIEGALPRGQGETVLLVDDELTIRKAADALLKRDGYNVILAQDGTEALALFAQRGAEIQVVLTDILMPHMDGVALIRTLRHLNPNVKIVASTGKGEEQRLMELESLGVHCLAKPYSRTDLLTALAQILRPSGNQSEANQKSI